MVYFAISLKCVLRELSPFLVNLQNSFDMHFLKKKYFEVLDYIVSSVE